MHRWWDGLDGERFWVEVTDRPDIGADLNAPQLNEQGRPQWSYDLLREPVEGDVVYHFDKPSEAFVAFSLVAGEPWPDDVVWGAKGTSARGNDVVPYSRPGWRRGLRGFTPFDPVTLEELRLFETDVLAIRDQLAAERGSPLYFPFVPYKGQSLRTFQGYFMKMPSALVALASLPVPTASGTAVADDQAPEGFSPDSLGVGQGYRVADESVAVSRADPMQIDPALVERGLRSHRRTQNLIAAWVSDRGLEPLSPTVTDPDWDVAWRENGMLFVAEVKSIHRTNEERQLRLAIGQVLRYRQRLSEAGEGSVQAVVVASTQPHDVSWVRLCESLNIKLWWPDELPHRDGNARYLENTGTGAHGA